MDAFSFARRTALGLLGTALAAAAMTAVAHSDELGASGAAHGFTLHDAQETLDDYCQWSDGRLYLTLPGGARFELVTSTADSCVSNPGDGSFHPFDPAQVRDALENVRYPLDGIQADVFLLPYPRRDALESAAGPQLVLLSPGVYPITPERQHAESVHELGHVVQYALMPDADSNEWTSYREMRGIDDSSIYGPWAPHADRPHEIFAEDFRALFGDALATYSGTIENSALTPPAQVPGLARFLLSLAGGVPLTARLSGAPNPTRGAVRFERAGGSAAPVDVFDLAGRRIATLGPTPVAGGFTWSWSGLDASGRRPGPGVVFARVRDGSGATARITLLP